MTGSVTVLVGEYINSSFPKVCGSAFNLVTISCRDAPRTTGSICQSPVTFVCTVASEAVPKNPSDLPGVTAALKCDITARDKQQGSVAQDEEMFWLLS
jgi:hypothetical protein